MRVHHIELLCKDLKLQVFNFCNRFGFSVYGTWRDQLAKKKKIVLKKHSIFFVLHQDKGIACDSIDNVALEVENPRIICNLLDPNMVDISPRILSENRICSIKSEDVVNEPSFVEAAMLRSPIGNIKHTLIDKRYYTGTFLPDFSPIRTTSADLSNDGCSPEKDEGPSDLDHVTFAVRKGTSLELMNWYKKFLGFSRCKVNRKEGRDGFTVKTSTEYGSKLGLRLTAMQYHFCSEEMLKFPPVSNKESDVKFVFAESLLEQGPNQVDTFLSENLGPGVQHIGLSSSNIFRSVDVWKKNTVAFINPPYQYYDEIAESIAKISLHDSRKLLEDHGVLLDIEDSGKELDETYLLQVFTKPIFDRQTFFFELIQRHGATGFGAGNISALWRAVEAYLRSEQQHALQ